MDLPISCDGFYLSLNWALVFQLELNIVQTNVEAGAISSTSNISIACIRGGWIEFALELVVLAFFR